MGRKFLIAESFYNVDRVNGDGVGDGYGDRMAKQGSSMEGLRLAAELMAISARTASKIGGRDFVPSLRRGRVSISIASAISPTDGGF